MSFHTGIEETILFKPWSIDSNGKFAAAFVGIFLLAMFYEFLKFFREMLYDRNSTPLLDQSSHGLLGGIRYSFSLQFLSHLIFGI